MFVNPLLYCYTAIHVFVTLSASEESLFVTLSASEESLFVTLSASEESLHYSNDGVSYDRS